MTYLNVNYDDVLNEIHLATLNYLITFRSHTFSIFLLHFSFLPLHSIVRLCIRKGNPWRRMEDLLVFYPAAAIFHINLHLLHFSPLIFHSKGAFLFFSLFLKQLCCTNHLFLYWNPSVFIVITSLFIFTSSPHRVATENIWIANSLIIFHSSDWIPIYFNWRQEIFRPSRAEFDGKLVELIKGNSFPPPTFHSRFSFGEKALERCCRMRDEWWKWSKEMLSLCIELNSIDPIFNRFSFFLANWIDMIVWQ